MRVALVEWPDGLKPEGPKWHGIADRIASAPIDLLVTNELPFGPWIAASPDYDPVAARVSVELHEAGIAALNNLNIPSIISSRPLPDQGRLANEAILLRDGQIVPLHRKRHMPSEAGWHEQEWYVPGDRPPPVVDVDGVKIGALICTEAMYSEDARGLGAAGADLILVPRATGADEMWATACAMAAVVGGAYVLSSNRAAGRRFGGRALAFGPDGSGIAMVDVGVGVRIVTVDPARSRRRKTSYPCYLFAGDAAAI